MLTTYDTRNIYLTGLGLKPASEFILADHSFVRSGTQEDIKTLEEIAQRELQHANITHFSFTHLISSKIKIASDKKTQVTEYNWKLRVNVGRDKESLMALVGAGNSREFGLACGFPINAVRAYERKNPQTQMRAWKIWMQLADAHQKGITAPEWYAFAGFVPSNLDLIQGKICRQSEKLSTVYMNALQEHVPNLYFATLLEDKVPVSYKMQKNESPRFEWKSRQEIKL